MAVNTVPHQLDVVNAHPPTRVLPLRRLTIYHLPDIHALIDRLRAQAILLCPIATRVSRATDLALAGSQLRRVRPRGQGVGRHRPDTGGRRAG